MFDTISHCLLLLAVASAMANNGDRVTLKGLMAMVRSQHKIVEHFIDAWEKRYEESRPIAFYAEMTTDFTSKGPGTKLVFNRAVTNVLNAYNKATGVYIVPKAGLYVFTWVAREHKSQHSIELMVNKDIRGATFKRAQNNDDGSVSGTAVLQVKKGDEVYLRFHSGLNEKQRVHNNHHGRSSFSGYRLR